MKKLIYLAPDIDLSKNEGGKVHTLGEIKYLQEHFDIILLVSQNQKAFPIDPQVYQKIKTLTIPHWLHQPIFRILFESTFLIFYALYLRASGYQYTIERSYRFGGWFSIFFSLTGGKSLYLMIEPLYYGAPLLDAFTKLMARFLNIFVKYFLITYPSMAYLLLLQKTKIVWTGVDSEFFNPQNTDEKLLQQLKLKPGQTIIFYSGSIQNWHSVDLILEGAQDQPEIIFLLVISGKTQDIENLKNKIIEKNLKNIIIKENLSNQILPHYINLATICLALYDKNNEVLRKFNYFYSPLKVHEYKACGKPLIATNVGNLIPLVSNCGILIENNKENLKNAILKLLSDKNLYIQYSEKAIKEVQEKYNWKTVANYYDELFQQ